jgi:hypothetical protein
VKPPSYHIPRLLKAPLGHFYDVASNGYGTMLGYSAQIPARDRWDIVAYIRALQLSENASQADVPAGQQIPSQPPQFKSVDGSGATLPAIASPEASKPESFKEDHP